MIIAESRSHYDKDVDDLLISNRTENEIVKKNFMFDDFIISITESGKIVGLEIRNVSKFLIEAGLNPEILKTNKGVELRIIPRKEFIGITIVFSIPERNEIIERKVAVTHLPMQVTC